MAPFGNSFSRAAFSSGLLVSTLALLNAVAIAEDAPAEKAPAVGAKDPVETAFALPKGVVLNSDQQVAYDKLKQDKEATFRLALDDVKLAEGDAEKAKAGREVRKQRAEIRAALKEILKLPSTKDAGSKSPASSDSQGTNYGTSPPPPNYQNGMDGPYYSSRPHYYYQYAPYYLYPLPTTTSGPGTSTSPSKPPATKPLISKPIIAKPPSNKPTTTPPPIGGDPSKPKPFKR